MWIALLPPIPSYPSHSAMPCIQANIQDCDQGNLAHRLQLPENARIARFTETDNHSFLQHT
jgi:hypothetical protein